LGQKL